MKQVAAQRPLARVSLRDSVVIFRRIRNKPLSKVKRFLNDLLEKKININSKK